MNKILKIIQIRATPSAATEQPQAGNSDSDKRNALCEHNHLEKEASILNSGKIS